MNSQKSVNHVVSHVSGVKKELRSEAYDIMDAAKAIHETYHDPHDKAETKFSVTTGDVDSFVNLDHPAVIPREFGWKYVNKVTGDTKWVAGKFTLQRAAMLKDGYG